MMRDIDQQLELICRGAEEVIPLAELKEKLKKGKPLSVKFGADPSAPDLHLGHFVIIKKLKALQGLGHEIVFLIGDFTGMIGDPSGKSETRKALTQEEVAENAKTYKAQIFKVLDPKKTKIVFNSHWLKRLGLNEVIRLSASTTVARMLERDDFSKRHKEERPIGIHEFIYPILQGYDSVVLKSDIEVGGSDQKFNLLMGRELQKDAGQEQQVIITLPLLEGTDGKLKMSKSYGNYIGLTESPKEIFGKLMSIPDELMVKYYTLLTDIPTAEIKAIDAGLKAGRVHPRETKVRLAQYLVTELHSAEAAQRALEEFEAIFKYREMPEDIPRVMIPANELEGGRCMIGKLLTLTKLCPSLAEARRKIEQNGVKLDGVTITDTSLKVELSKERILQVGKRNFRRVLKG